MPVSQINENVFVVVGGAFPKCNTVVVIADELVVIDPGCPVEDLRRFLLTQDIVLSDIDTIILTHIHPDHITHAMRLNRLSNCRIAANEITAPLFNEKEEMKRFLGFDKSNPVRKLWEQLVDEKMFGALDEGHVDEVLTDGDKFSFGNITLRTLYTPGHLPDHMCIEILEPNLIFAADIDLTEFGPFYGHPNSSISDFKSSIQMIKQGKYDGLISGHLKQPLVVDYKDRLTAYYRQFEIREDLVLSAILDGATTVAEITVNPIIYPSLTHPVYMQFERWMIEQHVKSLVAGGLVEEEKGKLSPI
jgi:glyoxylase-like metal-dependent hydrolase (beta-lactamase superfamily II)